MKKTFLALLLIAISIPSFAQSTLYPLPASWSLRAVASFSQPRILSLTEEDLAGATSASNGDIVVVSSGTSRRWVQFSDGNWETIGTNGTGTISSAGVLISISASAPASGYDMWLNEATNALSVLGQIATDAVTNPFPDPPTTEEWSSGTADYTIIGLNNYEGDSYKALDSDSSTYARMYVYDGEAGTYLQISCTETMEGPFTAFAFQIASSTEYAPATWSFSYSDNGSTFFVVASVSTPTEIATGGWYQSPEFPDCGGHYYYRLSFGPNGNITTDPDETSAQAVDIAELRLFHIGGGSIDEWLTVMPPASFTAQTPTIAPTTATPTSPATGTIWMDGNLTPPKMKAWDGTSWNSLW